MSDPAQLNAILDDGAARLRPIAQKTLHDVMTRMGLR
jgi:hypothetical protein